MNHRKGSLIPLIALLVLALTLPAAAGDFLTDNADFCRADGGQYTLNGAEGYVTVCDTPEGTALEYILNEQTVTVETEFSGFASDTWGLIHYESLGKGCITDDGGENEGWVRMSELNAVYTRDSFLNEHLDEFIMEEAELSLSETETVNVWRFPGCGGQAENVDWYLDQNGGDSLIFPAVWKDSLGRRWGLCSFEETDGFICLDDPGLTDNTLPEIAANRHVIPAADGATLPRILPVDNVSAASPVRFLPWLLLPMAAVGAGIRWTRKRRKGKHS